MTLLNSTYEGVDAMCVELLITLSFGYVPIPICLGQVHTKFGVSVISQ